MKTAFHARWSAFPAQPASISCRRFSASACATGASWRHGQQQQQIELAAAAEGRQLAPAQQMVDETRALNRNMLYALKQQEALMQAVLAMQKLLKPAVDTMGRALEVLEPLPGAVNAAESGARGIDAPPDRMPPPIWRNFPIIKQPFALFSNTVDTFDSKVNQALQQFAASFDQTLAKRQTEQALLGEYRETFVELQNSAASVMDTARASWQPHSTASTCTWTICARPPKPIWNASAALSKACWRNIRPTSSKR